MPVIKSSEGDATMPETMSEGGESGEGTGETTLIPKSMCPDMEVGDKVILRIVGGTEDQWEVDYPDESEDMEGGEGEGREIETSASEENSLYD